MALPKGVVYWTGHLRNSTEKEINASIHQIYDTPIIDNPSLYMVTVERAEISMNGIPFYLRGDPGLDDITITYDDTTTLSMRLPVPVYSLIELVQALNAMLASHDPAEISRTKFIINADGSITWDWFQVVVINQPNTIPVELQGARYVMNESLSAILGLLSTPTVAETAVLLESSGPRFDAGDQLDHMFIITNLPVVSDRLGQRRLRVLADFKPSSSHTTSIAITGAGVISPDFAHSFSPRQMMVYNPNERRYVTMNSNAPIDQVEMEGMYTDQDGNTHPIRLPKGCTFNLKVAFYLKK